MNVLTKEALLGASDLVEREVDLRPAIEGSVRVRSLSGAYSNEATSHSMEMTNDKRGAQTMRVNTAKLEELQVLHGLVDPKLTNLEEVRKLSTQLGPCWQKIVKAINDISGIDAESVDRTNAMFQPGGSDEAGVPGGDATRTRNGRSDLGVRAGA